MKGQTESLDVASQVVKFAEVIFITNCSYYAGRVACLDRERESLLEKRASPTFLVAHTQFFTENFQKG